jgi:hypothetical protein
MEDLFIDTTECPECSNENAYFNGLNYECPDCGCEWGALNDFESDDNLDDDDQKEKYFEKMEELMVGDIITEQTLRDLFSPSRVMEKNQILFKQDGIEEDFSDEIVAVLIKTKDFSSILKVKPKGNLPEDKINKIRKQSVSWYLSHQDTLPLFSSVSDWADYIQAPEDFIEKILPEKPHFISELPQPSDLTILFHKKIEKLYPILKRNKDISYEGKFSLDDINDVFAEIAEGERNPYPTNMLLEFEVRKHFSKEFGAIKVYRNDMNKWREGSFDHFLIQSKENRLSLIDTIVLVLKTYFKELFAL